MMMGLRLYEWVQGSKWYKAEEVDTLLQQLRELADKLDKQAAILRTGKPDFSDGLAASREESAAGIRAIIGSKKV
jgi:hypothetical protein